MTGWLTRLCLAAFLIWSLRAAFLGAPALNVELRSVGVAQDWRVPLSAALFDAPLYNYQLGFAEIFAERFLPGDAPSSDAERAERAARAKGFFDAALRQAPADAYAWTGRAWASLFRGDSARAAQALARSHLLAPASRELSGERVFIAEALADIAGGESRLTALGVDTAAICADLAFAERSREFLAGEISMLAGQVTKLCAVQQNPSP